MLFVPWRKEDELLPNGYLTYQSVFDQELENLPEMQIYHERLGKMEKNEKEAEEKITKLTQTEDCLEDATVNEQHANILEAELAMADIQAANRQQRRSVEEIQLSINKLNDDQTRIFNKIKKHFETKPVNSLKLFISGVGGSGKSFLISTISQWISVVHGGESSVTVAVTAPTGLAAYNIEGMTLHRLFMLPVEHGTTAKYNKLTPDSLKILKKALEELQLLIIDEISMVSSLLLTYIHLRLCELTGKECVFGGNYILVLGDLLQLPPVKGSPNISHNIDH